MVQQLLLRDDQTAKSPQPFAQSSFRWQQQGAEHIPFVQKQISLSKSKDSKGKDIHASPQHFQYTIATGVKDFGRGQYKSLIQQCNGGNSRLSADLVNPFTLGLNDSLNKI
ncbi:hypothetical protein BTVI_82241 [Pitangus sulphuratus]|nr:hypothetical protein BTVI_82241 [Pitangus sulphuratus]